MSDDRDNFITIGSRARGGGGSAAPRQQVIRSKADLSNAQRAGTVTAERKFGGANARSAVEGQFLTKVDRADDIVKPKQADGGLAASIKKARAQAKNQKGTTMTQSELAKKCNVAPGIISNVENRTAVPDQKLITAMERALGVKLRGGNSKNPDNKK